MHALLVTHRTKAGQRDAVEAIWRQYMRGAVAENAGHLLYAYNFGTDPDVIAAFQIFASQEDAAAFLRTPGYAAYLAGSRDLLAAPPDIRPLIPLWIKAGGDLTDLVAP